MTPPLARAFTVEHLAAFDDDALEAFVVPLAAQPGEAELMGRALRAPAFTPLASRIARSLAAERAQALERARAADGDAPGEDEHTAQRLLVERLFWPLLYWHAPAVYDELTTGEDLHPALADELELDGRDVADLGCGSGRFTVVAAARARSVVAVDAAAPMARRLTRRLAGLGVTNVEVRLGSLQRLPLEDRSVDVAVACSSLGARPQLGGEAALDEMRRVLRPGGLGAVIWPDDPAWFVSRGMSHVVLRGSMTHRFRCEATARRLCRLFYGDAAAAWVRRHRTAAVPYSVLGMRPPADLCLLRV